MLWFFLLMPWRELERKAREYVHKAACSTWQARVTEYAKGGLLIILCIAFVYTYTHAVDPHDSRGYS